MNLTSSISLWLSNNALGIGLIIVFIILGYKFLEWYLNNKKKVDKFMNKLKGGKNNKNGMAEKKSN